MWKWQDREEYGNRGQGTPAVDGVEIEDDRIESIRTLDGAVYRGSVFIDATYEGDLMAAAGVTYRVGRESTEEYGEQWAGVQKGARHYGHFFPEGIDPYRVPGDPSSGLLPRISPEPPGDDGTGDHRIQAYCCRMYLTRVDENRVPFPGQPVTTATSTRLR